MTPTDAPAKGATPALAPRDPRRALVLFSGGQDSTACLAWALQRFAQVETVGFDYGQRHRVELDCRITVIARLRQQFPEITSRSDKKKLNSLISSAAGDEIRDRVKSDPSLIGKTIDASILLSSEADLYYKGLASSNNAALLDSLKDKAKLERNFSWRFWTNGDSREPELAGLHGAIVGSLLTVALALLLGLPLGVAAAIYLEQFAKKNRWTDLIEVNINNLAAVPSIIFGLLGLAIFLNVIGLPRSTPIVGGVVLALLVLPTIIIASRAALNAVPPSIKEAALGVGASDHQAVFHHVLPLALPGILT